MACPHGHGEPEMCSQCRAAPARRVTRDPVTGGWLIDGKPVKRENEGVDSRMLEYAKRGGRARGSGADEDDDAN